MRKILKYGFTLAIGIIGVLFTFIPEDLFKVVSILPGKYVNANIIVNRIAVFVFVFICVSAGYFCYLKYRRQVIIRGKNYSVRIKYGNIFDMDDYKIVIPFDECFTTKVGSAPADINPTSLCGQYLKMHSINNIDELIQRANLKPSRKKSAYNSQTCYESGRVIPRNDYLLMAFAKLNADGRGFLSREEYLDALSVLWRELDLHYGEQSVCLPILGSGTTKIVDNELTQQELLDMMIYSYKLHNQKIQLPYELCIICRKRDDFSFDKIAQ